MIQIARSRNTDAARAVTEMAPSLAKASPALILCFSSTEQDPGVLSRSLHGRFPGALVAGCTTAGEISSGSFGHGGVVAMPLGRDDVETVAAAVVEDLGSRMDARSALAALEHQLGEPLSDVDLDRNVGIVLVDGLSGAEDRLMEALGRETDLPFIGGSAGDDLKFERTRLFLGGKVLEKAAVLLVMRLRRGFDILKTQSFRPTGRVLRATRVREEERVVEEFDGKPAVEAYAQALGIYPREVEEHFKTHPLAMMVGGSPFVRAPRAAAGSGILFLCRIREGTELALMESGGIVADTRAAVRDRVAELGGVSGAIDFHCTLRAQELEARGHLAEYGAIWADIPAIGFATYGECWMYHMNQTSTILLLR